jgi:hypothetical protein
MDGSYWNIIGNTLVASVSIFVGAALQKFPYPSICAQNNLKSLCTYLGGVFLYTLNFVGIYPSFYLLNWYMGK